MQYQFTPAAERALSYACGCSSRNGCDELEAEALLLGLLAQPECRAAAMLTRVAIDIPAVRRRWPDLSDSQPVADRGAMPFSRDIEISLHFASERLFPFPRPTELATEHLLLGLATAEHEVSQWLRQEGLDPDAVEAEIHRLYGHQLEPIPIDWEIAAEEAKECSADVCASNDTDESRCGAQTTQPNSDTPPPSPDAEGAAGTAFEFSFDTSAGRISTVDSQQTAVLRVLDASANRAREGLRVIEDYVRFVLDDRHLT
jgi:thiamine-phosphate pyrophosphorylase